ncbi:MAG: hypothetical protein A2Y93_04490 [Chloroflexi bacterium RBG_13_68_17]|nr:MAG: hypothetical protein A2Y93_04490 [Chloroflexi bacterium RBG_13_68_17]
MSDSSELRRRLERLSKRRQPQEPQPARRRWSGLPPGEEVPTAYGPAYRIERSYPLKQAHGPTELAELLGLAPELAADVAGRPALAEVPPQRLTFLDTETTGLVGGAGTLVFLVGVGTFTEAAFRVRQYFLRDPGEEPAMLEALQNDLDEAGGFVTFNGQAFDLPLLEIRYRIGLRRDQPLTNRPHLDLLFPSRRLWQSVLPDCSLGTLERHILGLERAEADVPGALIPALYLEYLRSGDATDMSRVVYHNAMDVLSLVSLAVQVLGRHRQEHLPDLSGAEALAVARWHYNAGRFEPAETAYRTALSGGSQPEVRLQTLRRYTFHLKRTGRWGEAVEMWQEWHSLSPEDPVPCLEIAKYYEWRAGDYDQAQRWAEAALISLTHWDPDWRRDEAWAAVEHRLRRLIQKLGQG